MDWTASEIAFPALNRNSVRSRVSRLREDVAYEAYIIRLEEAFFALWLSYKGTDELPDDNPTSFSDFDIIAWINFLRSKIDKAAL